MAHLRMTLAAALVAALALPAIAAAKPNAQPLVDQAPLGSGFKDRMFTSNGSPVARASLAGTWHSYPIKDGSSVSAAISDRYANTLDTQVVKSYVDFLDSLEHGSELSKLKIFIAPPDEVLSACGGQQ